MDGLELNKIAASILAIGLIMMVTGKIAGVLYHPETAIKTRGFQVEVTEDSNNSVVKQEEEVDLATLLASASIDHGKKVAKKCVACHTFEKGGKNNVGPNLYGILGDKIAANNAFAYSPAMESKGGGWDYDNLYEFLKNPKGYISGTKMAFVGLKKPKDLGGMLLYLRSLNDVLLPLPSPNTAPPPTPSGE